RPAISTFLAEAWKLRARFVVTQRQQWSASRHRRLVDAADTAGMTVIEPRPAASATSAALRRACSGGEGAVKTCALSTTPPSALRVARQTLARFVVVHVATPSQLGMLAKFTSKRPMVVAIVPAAAAKPNSSWSAALQSVAQSPAVRVAVAPAAGDPAVTV